MVAALSTHPVNFAIYLIQNKRDISIYLQIRKLVEWKRKFGRLLRMWQIAYRRQRMTGVWDKCSQHNLTSFRFRQQYKSKISRKSWTNCWKANAEIPALMR